MRLPTALLITLVALSISATAFTDEAEAEFYDFDGFDDLLYPGCTYVSASDEVPSGDAYYFERLFEPEASFLSRITDDTNAIWTPR